MTTVDFGKTAHDYAKHRAGFPPAFFERLGAFGVGREGQRAVDLGTGTGTVARGLALRGVRVIGVDPSADLTSQARALDREAGVTIEYVRGTTEDTGLPAASFDVVTAGQCWHWFDRTRAANEAHRLLRPGGALVVAHFDWLVMTGGVVEATEALIARHNPDQDERLRRLGQQGLYPAWLRDVREARFESLETFSFDVDVSYTHEAWRGRVRASAGIGAALSAADVARFDEELAALLARSFEDPLAVPHRVWALVARAPRLPSSNDA